MLVKRASLKQRLCMGAALAILAAGAAETAAAQAAPAPPVYQTIDVNGVDLSSGQLVLADLNASVGPAGQGLVRMFLGDGLRDNMTGTITLDSSTNVNAYVISLGGRSTTFRLVNGVYYAHVGSSGKSLSHTTGSYTFTDADGTVATFDETKTSNRGVAADVALLTSVRRPDGEILTYSYDSYDPACGQSCSRLRSIASNLGYALQYEYQGTGDANDEKLARVTAVNLAQQNCTPSAGNCSPTTWSYTTFTGPDADGLLTATDALGRKTLYTFLSGQIHTIQRPDQGAVTYDRDAENRVIRVTRPAVTTPVAEPAAIWQYAYSGIGGLTTTVTDPRGFTQTVVSDGKWGTVSSATNVRGDTTQYVVQANTGLVTSVIYPEGNHDDYEYLPSWGALDKITRYPKPNQGHDGETFVTSIAYDPSCYNNPNPSPLVCNKPISVTEGASRTDFTYNAGTGQIATLTGPTDQDGSTRAQTRSFYRQLSATYWRGGTLQADPNPVWVLDYTSSCRTGSSCSGTDLERVVQLGYAAPGGASNLEPSSITTRDGSSKNVLTTNFTYNRFGDVRTIDGPLQAPADDTVRLRYDDMRQLIGRIEVDPDGQGTGRPALATKYNYRNDGQISSVQHGTVASQSDDDFNLHFNKVYTQGYVYDERGRPNRVFVKSFDQTSGAATDESATDIAYFANNDAHCEGLRMNRSALGGVPLNACQPSAATSGQTVQPDRLTTHDQNPSLRQVSVTNGDLTADHSQTVLTYTRNGKLSALQDGDLHTTTFDYDWFDRPLATHFADGTSVTKGYSANWDPTSETERDGETVTFQFDPRHRIVSRSGPGPIAYAYDNFDNQTSATNQSSGEVVSRKYDALSRVTESDGWWGAIKYAYDAGGRRQQMTWPDGFYVTYSYDAASELTAISEYGSTTLAAFSYDNLGRRSTLALGANAATTTYGYDALSRLTILTHDLAGSSSDLTSTFQYDPSSQIHSKTRSNSLYAWTGSKSSQHYDINALNQVTSESGRPLGYDQKGNLTSYNGVTYGYDVQNKLTTVVDTTASPAASSSLSYDPTDQLEQVSGPSTARFAYDGADLIGEYDGANHLLRRYVHGLGDDEPLVWYEGSGIADRRWLQADERGSIISVANNAGQQLIANTYDEYGKPGATNQGRFSFTGQVWLPEATYLQHFKARDYRPNLGRFLQPDPTGFAAGVNQYAYVQDDPLNQSDWNGAGGGCGSPDEGCIVYPMPPLGNPDIQQFDGMPHLHPTAGGIFVSDEIVVVGHRSMHSRISGFLFNAVSTVCKAIPDAGSLTATFGLGGIGSGQAGGTALVNTRSGQISLFANGGFQGGWNGGASASLGGGAVYGLGSNNAGYSGAFTGANLSLPIVPVGINGQVGTNAQTGQMVTEAGIHAGANLTPSAPSGGITRTVSSSPLNIGNIWKMPGMTTAKALIALRNLAC